MTQIIDGKRIAQEIKDEANQRVELLQKEGKEVALSVIQVGADPPSM